MTVTTTESVVTTVADGVQTEYSFLFPFIETDDIYVYINGSLVLDTTYILTPEEDNQGGTITFDSPPVAGSQVLIQRQTPMTQTTDYPPYGPFPAEAHERALDKLTILVQEAVDATSTTLTLGFRYIGQWTYPYYYEKLNIVTYGNNIYICNTDHTSSSPIDFSNWTLLIDLTAVYDAVDDAQAAQAAAELAQSLAEQAQALAEAAQAAAEEAQALAEAAQLGAETAEGNAAVWAQDSANCAQAAFDSATAAADSASEASDSADDAAASAALVDLPSVTLPDDYGKGLVVNDDGAGNPKFKVTEITARNLMFNTSLRIAQIGTQFQWSTYGNVYTLDGVNMFMNTTGAADFTVGRSNDIPLGGKAIYGLKISTVTQQSSVASTDRTHIGFKLEGKDFPALWYGTVNAKPLVLTMWVKSSDAGDHSFWVQNTTAAVTMPLMVTIDTADTWEFKIIHIPGDVTNSFSYNEETALSIYYAPMTGTDYINGNVGEWYTDTTARTFSGAVNLFANASGYFQINDAKLELGPIPTSYFPRDIDVLYSKTLRYFRRLSPLTSNYTRYAQGYWGSNTLAYATRFLDNPMRIEPVLDSWSGDIRVISTVSGIAVTTLDIATNSSSTQCITFQANVASGGNAGYQAILYTDNDSTSYIDVNARL